VSLRKALTVTKIIKVKQMIYTLKIKDGMAVSTHFFITELSAIRAAKAMVNSPNVEVTVFEGDRLEGKVVYQETSYLDLVDLVNARSQQLA